MTSSACPIHLFSRCTEPNPGTRMARITASVYTSHVPAIGAALDLGKSHEPYWQKVFSGYEFGKKWLHEQRPDVVFLVFNKTLTDLTLAV